MAVRHLLHLSLNSEYPEDDRGWTADLTEDVTDEGPFFEAEWRCTASSPDDAVNQVEDFLHQLRAEVSGLGYI